MDDLIEKWERLVSLWRKKEGSDDNISDAHCEDKEMLQQIFEIRQAMNGLKTWEYNVSRGWRKVCPRKGRLAMFQFMRYAAVILGGSLGIYFYVHEERERNEDLSIERRIEPGKLQAELRLATGEHLALDVHQVLYKQEQSGVEIVNDTVSGRVYYKNVEGRWADSLKFNTLIVPNGGEYSLELSDGTIVWINSESSLRFPEAFAENRREVYLKGEAYFQVEKDADKPFFVHTDVGDVRVMGTSFNVSAYPDDKSWQTTLVEGSVVVLCEGKEVLMKPSEQYEIGARTGEGRLKEVNPELYISWREGKFYFKVYTFEELVVRLERWYDFKMFYANESIRKRRFSGVVNKHQPLHEMLKFLEMTSDVRFSVKGNVVTASLTAK